MCNACGFMCCAWDGFEKCGCSHCDNPACWDDDEDEFGGYDDDYEDEYESPRSVPAVAAKPTEEGMKVALESTSKIVELQVNGVIVPARVWQGETESGIPVHAFITRIAPEIPKSDPNIDKLTAEFERDLQRCADPRVAVAGIPLRLVL